MTVAARLINADLGFRVLDLGLDGFDTHDDEPPTTPILLTQLDTGLQAFFATLDPAFYNRVTIMTIRSSVARRGRTTRAAPTTARPTCSS